MGSLLTVVVPIYNVARYLAECLDSLAGQSYSYLDVVLVDDGSTDDSAEVAQRYVRADHRFRLISQENRGLGAARNTGIDSATGEYLAFVDSDDVLPPYAFEVLVGALEQTGSDFASGNVVRLTSRGLRQSPLHRGTHRETVLRTSVAKRRNLVYDRLACNKVFRRSFWEQHGLRFPEGVRYEDIPVTIPALALAGSVDVIDLPVYYWRQREVGDDMSISQRQTEVRNVVDRFAAVDSASRSLLALGDRKLKDWYDQTVLRSDLRMFLDHLPDVDDEYRQRFLDLTVDFLSRVDDRVIGRLISRLRVAWGLARARALPELLAVVAASRQGMTPPVVRRGTGHYYQIPLLDVGHPAAPRELFRVPDWVYTEVHEAQWRGGRLHVRGLAYHAALGARRSWDSARMLWLREDAGSRRVVPLPSLSHRVAQAPSSVPYPWAGFAITLDPRRLRVREGWVEGDWTFNVVVFGAGRSGKRTLQMGEQQPALSARWVADGVRVVPYVRNRVLRLRVERPRTWITAVRVSGDALLVDGAALASPEGAVLRLTRASGVIWRSYPVTATADDQWSASLPLADLVAGSALGNRPVFVGEAGAGWRVTMAHADGESQELPVSAGFAGSRHTIGDVELMARPADDDVLWLRALPPGPVVSGADLTDGVLTLTGALPDASAGWDDLHLVLRQRDSADPTELPSPDVEVPVEVTDQRWTARITLAGEGAPADGDWLPLYRSGPGVDPVDLPFDVAARRMLPRDVTVDGRRVELLPERERETLRLGRPLVG